MKQTFYCSRATWLSYPTDRRRRGVGFAILTAAAFALAPDLGHAADWSADAGLREIIRYDDNTYLSSVDEVDTAASVTSPYLSVTGAGPRSNTEFNLDFDIVRYLTDAGEDYENASAEFKTDINGLRSSYGFELFTEYRTTLETEESDTGVLIVDGYRLNYGLAPHLYYQVTQRGTVGIGGSWHRVKYFDVLGLNDYRAYNAFLSYDYRVTELDRLGLQLGYSKYENDTVNGVESETATAQLLWRRDVAERLSTHFLAGPRVTRQTDALGVETDSNGADVRLGLDWRASELTNVSLAASRSVTESGTGTTVQRDLAEMEMSRRVYQTLTIYLAGLYQHDEDVGDLGVINRDFVSVSPSLRWHFARDWRLSVGYRYRWEDEAGADAESNMAFIGLTYNIPTWKIGD